MKEKMYSKHSNNLLHHHILDGFASSHAGIKNLKDEGIIQDAEYLQLIEKNIERLLTRIKEFRITEKLLCIFFAAFLGYMQITDEDMELRRARRVRLRRRNQTEITQ